MKNTALTTNTKTWEEKNTATTMLLASIDHEQYRQKGRCLQVSTTAQGIDIGPPLHESSFQFIRS